MVVGVLHQLHYYILSDIMLKVVLNTHVQIVFDILKHFVTVLRKKK